MRLAYADPPYPGKAHLYPENTEVDHAELVARLAAYDGWALSTDETSLRYVLGLCPDDVRICAWCRTNDPPFTPNPVRSWEPVIVSPARTRAVTARSFLIDSAPSGFLQRDGLTGQKSRAFCDWVLRCIGAEQDDSLDDLFPGTGVMGETFASFNAQLTFPSAGGAQSVNGRANVLRRTHDSFEGVGPPPVRDERRAQVALEKRGSRLPLSSAESGNGLDRLPDPERSGEPGGGNLLDKEKGEHLGSPAL